MAAVTIADGMTSLSPRLLLSLRVLEMLTTSLMKFSLGSVRQIKLALLALGRTII